MLSLTSSTKLKTFLKLFNDYKKFNEPKVREYIREVRDVLNSRAKSNLDNDVMSS